jgi:hypothetical protein
MNDIRLIGSLIYFFLLSSFLCLAKVFGVSLAWVWWPMGILGISWAIVCYILTTMGPIL